MNPFNFINWKDQFANNGMPNTGSTPDQNQSLQQLQEVKNMVNEYRTVLNDEFWSGVNGLSKKKVTVLPIELWESKKHIYLLILAPGLEELKDAQILFKTNQLIRFKIKFHSIKPEEDAILIQSELPLDEYEREIQLSESVIIDHYSLSFENGLLTYTFRKAEKVGPTDKDSNNQINIPFNF